MGSFLALAHSSREPLGEATIERWARRLPQLMEMQIQSANVPGFLAVVAAGSAVPPPSIEHLSECIVVGTARLDDRDHVARILGAGPEESDLAVVARAVLRRGTLLREVYGEFSVVVWDAASHRIIAARDALGVYPLYHSDVPDGVLLSSRLSTFGGGHVDPEFVADFLVGYTSPSIRQVWAGVTAIRPGAVATGVTDRNVELVEYWNPRWFAPKESVDPRECLAEFREHLAKAVVSRITDDASTWAELSGGIDSSSIVAMAQSQCVRTGRALGGTLTIVETMGEGDERDYVKIVLDRYPLRNEIVTDMWPWQDTGEAPPITDEPRPFYPFYARDLRRLQLARSAGARVVLSGLGADHYLTGNHHYIADLVSRFHLRQALQETWTWSCALQTSLWSNIRDLMVVPFLPDPTQRGTPSDRDVVPSWIKKDFADQYNMRARLFTVRNRTWAIGGRFQYEVANEVAGLFKWVYRGVFDDQLEFRYPFLDRRLVEFGLALPVKARMRPGRAKWILRESMREYVPEGVLRRPTKGALDARIIWAFEHEYDKLRAMLCEPILAELGFVDAIRLRKALDDARVGNMKFVTKLFATLALETWLMVYYGRWQHDNTLTR